MDDVDTFIIDEVSSGRRLRGRKKVHAFKSDHAITPALRDIYDLVDELCRIGLAQPDQFLVGIGFCCLVRRRAELIPGDHSLLDQIGIEYFTAGKDGRMRSYQV